VAVGFAATYPLTQHMLGRNISYHHRYSQYGAQSVIFDNLLFSYSGKSFNHSVCSVSNPGDSLRPSEHNHCQVMNRLQLPRLPEAVMALFVELWYSPWYLPARTFEADKCLEVTCYVLFTTVILDQY